MKRLFRTKRRIIAATVAAGVALGGGAAIAYFTGSGTGTGSGAVGTVGTDIHVIGTETTALFPGDGTGGTVSFTAWNSGTGHEELSNIHLTNVTAKNASNVDVSASCPFSDSWSMADVPTADNLAPNGTTPGSAISETGKLYMKDNGLDQSACEGATLTLTFSTS